MARKRKQPTTWIHRNSRYLLAGVATAGLLLSIGCMAKGNSALSGSAYVQLGGLSLPLKMVIAVLPTNNPSHVGLSKDLFLVTTGPMEQAPIKP
ncbi:MAG: hypothetical protein AAFQ76_05155 [Cyanobacteria bacterium J06626_26]